MITKRTSNKRLLLLAIFLERLDPQRFHYGSWVGDDWGGAKDLSCGTTACALGWACTMPEFHKLGLGLNTDGTPYDYVANLSDSEAAMRVFGITQDEAHALFLGYCLFHEETEELILPTLDNEAMAQHVARRIRKFVEVRA
jgi:hypothetical protein